MVNKEYGTVRFRCFVVSKAKIYLNEDIQETPDEAQCYQST